MWKYGNDFLRQKFSNWKRSVSWRVIVLQHPIVCNVPLDPLDPFSKSFQDIFVEGVINCLSWRCKFFVHNATAVGKKKSWFSPRICSWVLTSDEENFSCAISHFAVWSRDRSRTPMIHLLLLLYAKKCGSISSLPSKSWQISIRFAFCSTDKLFGTNLAQIFRMCKCSVTIYEPHFYSIPFLLQSPWHSIGGLSPSQLAPLPNFDHLLTRVVFQNEGRLQHFLGPLWKLCATKKPWFSKEWNLHKLRLKKQMSLWQICWVSHKIW